jgi:hypothetical protein
MPAVLQALRIAFRRLPHPGTPCVAAPIVGRSIPDPRPLRADSSAPGTRIEIEWTVEARRHRTPATVVELAFFNPNRKTSTVAPSEGA